jgi:sec-independent protein translocase protein TatA
MHLGAPEIILIVVVILLLFGGKKLPELARGIGRGLSEFRRATHDIQQEIQSSIEIPSTPPHREKKPEPPSPPKGETTSESSNEPEDPSSPASEESS